MRTISACKLFLASLVCTGALAMLLHSGPVAATPQEERLPFDLTANWSCDDDGTYAIRQVGRTVWWLGTSKDDGKTWTNVFRGTVEKAGAGYIIRGEWADVPRGSIRNSGIMVLAVDGDSLHAQEVTGGFGGRNWKRN